MNNQSARARVGAAALLGVGFVTFAPAVVWQLTSDAAGLSESALIAQSMGLGAIGGVGFTLALKRPSNAIGWIFLSVWAYSGLYMLVTAYAQSLAIADPAAAFDSVATWLVNWAWVPIIGTIAFFPVFLFPTGHAPGPRTRPLIPLCIVLLVVWSLAFAFQPSQYANAFGEPAGRPNPFASRWLPGVIDALPLVFALVYVGFVLVALGSLVLRFRAGNAVIRAQMKWFLLGALTWLPVLLYPGDHGTGGAIDILVGVALAALPLAMAVAILRYHLYDIDRIISRTTSYAIVTATVIAVYAIVVTTVTRLLPDSNQVAVAGATLTAAALARPLLRRVQDLVDRRFNRSRFEANETVDAFGTRLQGSVEPDVVGNDLVAVVSRTLQPSEVSLWVRGDAG